MISGNLDANWSEDPTQQPALNPIVIDKPVYYRQPVLL